MEQIGALLEYKPHTVLRATFEQLDALAPNKTIRMSILKSRGENKMVNYFLTNAERAQTATKEKITSYLNRFLRKPILTRDMNGNPVCGRLTGFTIGFKVDPDRYVVKLRTARNGDTSENTKEINLMDDLCDIRVAMEGVIC